MAHAGAINGGQGAQGVVRQSPRLARQALLRAPVNHVGLTEVGAEFSRARVYQDPVECCLNADRTFVGVWSARGGLLARALFHPGAVQADVSRAAGSLRKLVMVAHLYLTSAGGQVGNGKELGLAKSALKRLADKYSPSLHVAARTAVLIANLPAFWTAVCAKAAETDAENDQLYGLLFADATSPPAPYHLDQTPALPNPPQPQAQAPVNAAPVPIQPPAPVGPPPALPVPARVPAALNPRAPGPAVQPQGPGQHVIQRRQQPNGRGQQGQQPQPVQGNAANGNAAVVPVPGNVPNPRRARAAAAGPHGAQGQHQQQPMARRRRRSPSSDSSSSASSSDSAAKRPRRN